MSRTLLILIMALAFGACGNAGPKRPPAAAATTPGNAKVKTYNGRGIVTKIDLKLVSVELDHEKIEGLMDAMRMEFYVKEKSELETLRIGDKVEFVLEDNAGAERIIRIAKAE